MPCGGLQTTSDGGAVYERLPKFKGRAPPRDPCRYGSTGMEVQMGRRDLSPSPSLAILLDLGRPDLDSWRFQTGDSGHLRDRDSAFDENGDSLLE